MHDTNTIGGFRAERLAAIRARDERAIEACREAQRRADEGDHPYAGRLPQGVRPIARPSYGEVGWAFEVTCSVCNGPVVTLLPFFMASYHPLAKTMRCAKH